MKTAIIGGGFSGLLAAYFLEKEGQSVTLYEKEASVGGQCRTFYSKGLHFELGTFAVFSDPLKELLTLLQVPYTKKHIYKSFLDDRYKATELLSRSEIPLLLEELERLSSLMAFYPESMTSTSYEHIHPDLLVPFLTFLQKHDLVRLGKVIAPHLSACGFGDPKEVETYYAFKAFNLATIKAFIHDEQLLFIDGGTSKLMQALSDRITDIRCRQQVESISLTEGSVKVKTNLSEAIYDQVLITAKLPDRILQDAPYSTWMQQIVTNPYVACAFEVSAKRLVPTFYKANLGKKNKIQFFSVTKENDRTVLIAYSYGRLTKDLVDGVTEDLIRTGIEVCHLITAKQWQIFPHMKSASLSPAVYPYLDSPDNPVHFIGSLVTEPSLSSLYLSVKESVAKLIR